MLYVSTDGYGNYYLYEATAYQDYDRVTATSRSISSVQSSYDPIRRLNVIEDI